MVNKPAKKMAILIMMIFAIFGMVLYTIAGIQEGCDSSDSSSDNDTEGSSAEVCTGKDNPLEGPGTSVRIPSDSMLPGETWGFGRVPHGSSNNGTEDSCQDSMDTQLNNGAYSANCGASSKGLYSNYVMSDDVSNERIYRFR